VGVRESERMRDKGSALQGVAVPHSLTTALWDSSLVQGPFSVAPCQTLTIRFATQPFASQRCVTHAAAGLDDAGACIPAGTPPAARARWSATAGATSSTVRPSAAARSDERAASRRAPARWRGPPHPPRRCPAAWRHPLHTRTPRAQRREWGAGAGRRTAPRVEGHLALAVSRVTPAAIPPYCMTSTHAAVHPPPAVHPHPSTLS
jgi:hypothetical protein